MTTALLDTFIDRCDGEKFPPNADVDAERERIGISEPAFIESFALRVAERYASRDMTFDRADALMNDVYAYYLFRHDEMLPGVAWSLYLAFDAGEYHRDSDPREVDPSEKYTRPEVESILAKVREAYSRPLGG